MSKEDTHKELTGELQRLLFSPKGGIEGLLLAVASKTVQVTMDASVLDPVALSDAVGKTLQLKVVPDRSHKAKDGAHPVFKLEELVKIGGRLVRSGDPAAPIRGVVAAIHYAKHGEPNGVILESGEFVHTRPPGMKKLGLAVGSSIVAIGDTRMTVLGTPLIEAREVNRVRIE